METWFKDVGRPALLDALNGVCNRIDDELGEGLKSYRDENARLSSELQNLRSKISDADRLKEENLALKREVQKLRGNNRAGASSLDRTRDARSPLTPKSVNQVSNLKLSTKSGNPNVDELDLTGLKEEYIKLNGNYTKLHAKYLELEDAHSKLNQRLREKTKAYNQWMDHANQLDELCKKRSRIIKKLEAKLDSAAAVASGPFDESFSSDTPVPPLRKPQVAARESVDSDVHDDQGATRFTPSLERAPPGQPTAIKVGRNRNNSPDRVSSEPIRAKTVSRVSPERNTTTVSESCISTVDGESYQLPPLPQNRDTNAAEALIKTEPSSDPPVIVSERCVRKRKHDDRTENITNIKTEDSFDPLVIDERPHFMPQESIDFDADGVRVVTPRKRNKTSLESANLTVSGSVKIPESHASFNPLGRLEDLGSDATRRRALFSDGGLDTPKATTKRPKVARLKDLLNTPSPGQAAIHTSLGVQSDPTHLSKRFEFQAPERRELPFNQGDPKKTFKLLQPRVTSEALREQQTPGNVSAKRQPGDKAKGSTTNSARPLRERPKSELGIADFKINPRSNEGYDYAFTDVVRNKNERANLEGCVQDGCCGEAFRLQARAKRDQTGPVDFQALLEKHLGDEAWKLSTMTKVEKEDMWFEAKTRELANEHGRHRHRFHRAASPVGFWRADFPSTQEEQRDREEAAKVTRRIIDERYREAMRPGGRWIFRDE
ncbi:SAE2-domain-containing protein [Daldinia caldariorum]|uniref:SAE2-domain-containing protein n=1 Tax=Daldinia caldariorum TaxID=326644 RepID=UPI002008C6E9|nr:SAE2-domain-containing protein [Daldinia caldariorum]KAI1467880.1 SAE2-domain-containing protein [Daldinia caldariorum]